MALTTAHTTRGDVDAGPEHSAEGAAERPRTSGDPARTRSGRAGRAGRARDADGMAVASFVLGLLGLLVANVFLGPAAVVLAGLALARGTGRRGRAALGLALGVADLAVLAALVASDHTLSWSLTG